MEKFQAFLDRTLGPLMSKLSSNRYLIAVRDGVVSALPLVIVGSFFMLVASPPLPQDWEIYKFLTANSATIMLPYRVTMHIMTLYAVFGMGNSLAKSFDLDGVSGGVLSVAAFMLTIVPVNILPDAGVGVSGFVLPTANLGSAGLFVGMIVTFFAINVFRFTNSSKFKIVMPEQVPPSVARSFEALTPTLIVVLVIGGLTYWAGFNWSAVISTLISPFIFASDSLIGVLVIVFFNRFLWFFGIHGASVVGAVARPLWLALIEQNALAAAAGVSGTELPTIASEPFYQWFVWVGNFALPILLVFVCKSKYLRDLGKLGFVPSMFNINEPITFGMPLVLNMTLAIPYILMPMILACVSWAAMSFGWVNRVIITAPWTLPGPIGAVLATGGDWRAAVLSIVLLLLACLIYLPFVKVYDKQFCKQEEEAAAE